MHRSEPTMQTTRSPGRRGGVVLLAVAAVLGSGACLDEPADPFVVTGEGAIEGQLYLDRDRNGVFDPSGGDLALSGVALEMRNRGTEQTVPGTAVSTGDEGRFQMASLPAGTHDLWADEATLPDGALLCRNPSPVSIYRFETASVQVVAEPVCLISIQEAKDGEIGAFVNVQGIVTAAGDDIRPDYTYVQDGSAGIRIFSSSFASSVERGQRVTLTATTGEFNNDLQLSSPTLVDAVDGVGVPVPQEVTTGEILAAGPIPTDPLQGRLVVIRGATLTRGFTSGGDRNGLVDDGTGTIEIRVERGISSDNGDAILDALGVQVGGCYDIVGVVGNFRGTAQIFPRDAGDVTAVACTTGGDA
jgi:hypothetical protein